MADIKKIQVGGVTYDVHDAAAREAVGGETRLITALTQDGNQMIPLALDWRQGGVDASTGANMAVVWAVRTAYIGIDPGDTLYFTMADGCAGNIFFYSGSTYLPEATGTILPGISARFTAPKSATRFRVRIYNLADRANLSDVSARVQAVGANLAGYILYPGLVKYTETSAARTTQINQAGTAGQRVYFGVTEWGGPTLRQINLRGYTSDTSFEILAQLQAVNQIGFVTLTKNYVKFVIGFATDALTADVKRAFLFGAVDSVKSDAYRERSAVQGQYISILGASISTFQGFIPDGYSVYYPHETTNAYPVTSVHDTYWMKTIDALKLNLLVNNSSAGSYVTKGHGVNAMAGCGDRCEALDDGTHTPDIIVIQLGGNDFTRNTALGTYDGAAADFPTSAGTFREGYANMLKRMTTKYPAAKIYCGTIPPISGGDYVSQSFPPKNTDGTMLEKYNEIIREMAALFNVNVVEFSRCGLTFQNTSAYMQDYAASVHYGQHPNAFGHSLMANALIRAIDPGFTNLYPGRIPV